MAGWNPLKVLVPRTALGCVVLALSACGLTPQEMPLQPVVVAPQPVLIDIPTPVATSNPVVVEPVAPAPSLITPAVPSEVAIVLSSRQPEYEAVANELTGLLGEHTVFDLGDRSEAPVTAFRRIQDSNTSAVVAIGLRAAISATAMSTVPVVFCQVFNVAEHNLLSANSRGVAALPPLDLQIAAWKKIDPDIQRIGAIIGEGHDDLIAEAMLAAETHGIELRIDIATSDRETLYLFNRMVRELDGFWLFPDNRVLSNAVLQKILQDATRQNVQVAVFNESLLELGAAFSTTTTDENIAHTIVDVLDDISVSGIDAVPPISPLSDIQIVTNEAVLEQLRKRSDVSTRQAALVAEQ